MPDEAVAPVEKELDEVSALAVRAKDDPTLMAELWDAVQNLVKLRAYRFIQRGGTGMGTCKFEADDLIQSGYFALLDAVRTYDPDKRAFSTHLCYRLRRRFAEAAGIKEAKLLEELEITISSLDIPVGEDGDKSIVDFIADPDAAFADDMPEEEALQQDCAALLEEIDKLPDQQRQALNLTARDGLTFRDAAKVMGCSDMAVKNRADKGAATVRETPTGQRIRRERYPFRHVRLSEFKTTFTSAVEWAVLWKEERGLLK